MTYSILALEQGSAEWKELRRHFLTASQAPVLFGISPYQERYDLYQEKRTGRELPIDSFKANLFAQGHAFEPVARAMALEVSGLSFDPAVLTSMDHPDLMASLDGFNEGARAILESKLMGREALAQVKAGILPPHHVCQIQAQLLVSGAERCIYVARDPLDNRVMAEVFPDPASHDRIATLACDFMLDVRNGVVPPLPAGKFEAMKRFIQGTYGVGLGGHRKVAG